MAGEERNVVCLIGDPKSPSGYKRISLMDVKECYNPFLSVVIKNINGKFVMTFTSPVEMGSFTSTTVAFNTTESAIDFIKSLQIFANMKNTEPIYAFDSSLSKADLGVLKAVIPPEIFDYYEAMDGEKVVPIVEDAEEDKKSEYKPFYLSNYNTFNIIDEHQRLIHQ
jgi:hypothetical protein